MGGLSNLPPGVHESSIPGNRPDDQWLDEVWDKIIIPADLVCLVPPETIANSINSHLDMLGTLFIFGQKDGIREAREMVIEEAAKEAFNDDAS